MNESEIPSARNSSTTITRNTYTALDDKLLSVPKMAEIREARDPLKLWQAIVVLLTQKNHGNTTVARATAWTTFSNMRQYQSESVPEFKARILNCMATIAVLSEPIGPDGEGQVTFRQPTEKEASIQFILGLDPKRYSTLLLKLANDLVLGSDKYPSDLTDAATLASRWQVQISQGPSDVGIHTSFNAFDKTKGKHKPRDQGDKTQRGPKLPQEKHPSATGKDKKAFKVKCHLCDGEHYMKDCPEFDDFKKSREN